MKGNLLAGHSSGNMHRVQLKTDGTLQQFTPNFFTNIGVNYGKNLGGGTSYQRFSHNPIGQDMHSLNHKFLQSYLYPYNNYIKLSFHLA